MPPVSALVPPVSALVPPVSALVPPVSALVPPVSAALRPSCSDGGSPTRDVKGSRSRSSFETFAAQTSDAWDADEDDLLRRLSLRHAHSAAVHVMSRHRGEQLARSLADGGDTETTSREGHRVVIVRPANQCLTRKYRQTKS